MVTPRPLFTPGKDPVPIVEGAGWAPGPSWTGAENLAHTGIRSRAVHPVASRYTVYASRPTFISTGLIFHVVNLKLLSVFGRSSDPLYS